MADDNLNKYSREEAKNANDLAQAARSLTEELKDQLGIRSRLNETEKETLNLTRQLQRSAQENTVEIGNQGSIERQLTKDRKLALNIERELADLKNNASESEIKFAEKIANTNDRINKIQKELAEASGKRAAELRDQLAVQEDILRFSLEDAKASVQRTALAISMSDTAKDLIAQRQEEAEIQKDINDKMGVTGALVKGTGALMERLGMRSGIFQDAMKESAEAMRDMAEETVRGTANFNKLQIMVKGFSKIASGFGKALFDPFTLITAIVSKFFELNAASTKLQQLTGQNAGLQAAHNTHLASGAQVMGLMTEMTEKTGIAAQAIFSSDDLGRLAAAQNLLGLSAEQASNLGMLSKTSGTSIQEYKEELVESVNSFNAMNDSAVAHGVVMKDVLNASADVAMSLDGNPKKIAAASSAARKLGLDLAKVNKIADGLMEFETSIGNELEAQLLTGKNINLSKARELALNNDLKGVAEELSKNGASAEEFANMNRIQQEAIAKAMGMNREEMGQMLINQKGMNNLSAEQRAKMRGVTLEQLEQMEAAESLKLAFSKIAEPLASILNTLSPILTMLAKAISLVAPFAPYVILGAKAFQMLNSGILSSLTNMKKLLKNTSLFGKMYKGGQFMPGGGRAAAGGQRAGGLFSKALGKSNNQAQKAAKKSGGGLGITKTISKIDTKALLRGAAAMVVVAGSIFIFAKSIQELEKIEDWGNIAIGLGAFAVTMGVLGAVGKVAGPGIIALGSALTAFGTAMLGPGGLGLLAIVGAAVGIGAAFALVGAGAMMFGKGIQFAAQGITTILTGITGLISNIPQLYLLGGALMSIAAGLGAISLAGLTAIPTLAALSGLALVSAPLLELAGMFNNNDNNSNESSGLAKVEAKLDKLISVVSQGGDVILDGNKVGSALVLGSYKSS